MRFALINPPWTFNGSVYFGCRSPHLPLEYGYAKTLLEAAGHEAEIFDAHLFGWTMAQLRQHVEAYYPDYLVVTTAPSYLFWRCPPPELRVAQETVAALHDCAETVIVVGPHASTTPVATLRKTGADVAVMGECEEVLPVIAEQPIHQIESIAWRHHGEILVHGRPHASNMLNLPALKWPAQFIRLHLHHHHRFDAEPMGPGAEVETSRGCPYHCTFCAKENFRNFFRRRHLSVVLQEIDALLEQGIEYLYFIDEIFLPDERLLRALTQRHVKFGMQTRLDLWDYGRIELLGPAGCVSIEAGVDSLSPEGRVLLDRDCRISTEELTRRLLFARRFVPFVQANLILSQNDFPETIEEWRQAMLERGVWANKPVPVFPYPGSPEYLKRWGQPDEMAWERAHEHYLTMFAEFSDIQDAHPLPLRELEGLAISHE